MTHMLNIELDNAEAVFRAGASVRGTLVVTLDADHRPRGITLQAIGTEFTNWGAQPAYIARTHPLDQTLQIWKPAHDGEVLPSGRHEYLFAIDLPANLPPSFDGVLTEIGYGLKAKVDLPLHIDMHAEVGFIVLAPVPAIAEPPQPVMAHDDSGRHITLELPRSVYRLGETLSGVVRVARPGAGRSRRLTVELLSRERGSAQGIWAEDAEREADARIELEQVAEDTDYPFAFKLPESVVPTFRGQHSELIWQVRARLEVARAHDLIAEVEVTLVEPG